jgi:two-component system, sensor histidine kinase PdtaS
MNNLLKISAICFCVLLGCVSNAWASVLPNYSDSIKAYLFTDNDKATFWALEYVNSAESENDIKERAIANNLYGHTFYNRSVYDTALHHYFKALDYCKKINDTAYVPNIYNSIASAYYWQGVYDVALENYNKALQLFGNLKDTFWVVNVRFNIANIHESLNEHEKAKEEYLKTYYEYLAIGDTLSSSYSLFGLGKAAYEQSQYDSAIQYYTRAIAVSKPDYDLYTYSLLHTRNGQALLKLNKLDEAFDYLKTGVETARQAKDLRQISLSIFELRNYYRLKKDYRNFTLLTAEYDSISETIFKQEQAEAIAEMSAKHKVELIREEVEIKQLENEKIQLRNRWLLGIITVVVLLLLLLSYFYFSMKKLNATIEKQNHELESLLKEKDVLLKEIHHRVKNNLQIVSSLLSLQTNFKQDDKNAENELQNAFMRINSMALLHKEIYSGSDITKANVNEYLKELTDQILSTFNGNIDIEVQLNIDKNLMLETEKAIPIGLILNELLTNSIKHKFINKGKGVVICKVEMQNDLFQITYSDFENNTQLENETAIDAAKGFGTKLIDIFCRKLKAEYNLKLTTAGMLFSMKFKILQS